MTPDEHKLPAGLYAAMANKGLLEAYRAAGGEEGGVLGEDSVPVIVTTPRSVGALLEVARLDWRDPRVRFFESEMVWAVLLKRPQSESWARGVHKLLPEAIAEALGEAWDIT